MGFEEFVDHDKKDKTYYATLALDDEPGVRTLIRRYDEHTAWDEFSEWLGERDFYRKYSPDAIRSMSDEDPFMNRMDCQIPWEEEFEKHGIERLKVEKVEPVATSTGRTSSSTMSKTSRE